MAGPLYTRLSATAERLIGKYGKAASLFRQVRTGPDHAPTIGEIEYAIKLVETETTLTSRPGTLVQTGDKHGLISTDAATLPVKSDVILIDGQRFRFVELQPMNPGALTLLSEFIARA